jgi:hypothetical protein
VPLHQRTFRDFRLRGWDDFYHGLLVPKRVAYLFLYSAVLDAFTSSHWTFQTFGSVWTARARWLLGLR